MSMTNRLCYRELKRLKTFKDRFDYLNLIGKIGEETFGFDRYLNQSFYRSREWKRVRDQVIIRDNGCDLGIPDREIYDHIIIHHMNPITAKDLDEDPEYVLNPEYLICVSQTTHNAIHYGDYSLIPQGPIERSPYDTCPWRK